MLSNLAGVFSLQSLDPLWRDCLHESRLVQLSGALKSLFDRLTGGSLAGFGSRLQAASFFVAASLFVVLPMRQFTNDKEGLALIAASGFAFWLLGFLLGGKERRETSAVDVLVLLYFGINIVATASSHYLTPAVRGLAKDAVYIVSYFYFTAILRNQPGRRHWIVGLILGAAFLVCLYGLYQYKIGVEPLATWEDPTVESKGTRIFSTLGNPNLLAGYLVPLAPLALALSFSAFQSRKFLLGVPALGVAAVIAVTTILTGSRGGYIGLFVAILSISAMAVARLWNARPKSRPWIITLCLVAPLVMALGLHFVPSFEQRITSIFAGREHSSNSFRMNVWLASWKMFKDNWWFGVGPGNQAFRLAYGLYMISGFDALGTYSVPLEIAVECGIFGVITFGALLLGLLSRGHLSFWSGETTADQWLTAGAVAAIIGLMAHGMVDTVFYRPQVQFIFWLAVALIVTAGSRDRH